MRRQQRGSSRRVRHTTQLQPPPATAVARVAAVVPAAPTRMPPQVAAVALAALLVLPQQLAAPLRLLLLLLAQRAVRDLTQWPRVACGCT